MDARREYFWPFLVGVCVLVAMYSFAPVFAFAHGVENHQDEADFLTSHPEAAQLYEEVSRAVPLSGVAPQEVEDETATSTQGILRSLRNLFQAFLSKFLPGDTPSSALSYPEIQEILSASGVEKQSPIYRKLIERVGPLKAQEALYRSGLPFTGETHLIQHEVGYYLYETEGKEGITKCTLYFLAACYHGLIIELLSYEGLDALPEVMDECWRVGHTVATQCAHGIGHGLLAWLGYKNLDKVLLECEEIAERSENFPLFNCYDGAFMENHWGLHIGGDTENRWLSSTDPYYPCDDPRIKDEWQKGCWSNQGSIMYQFYKGDIKKTSQACLRVSDADLRQTCFNSLSRQIHPLTKSNYPETARLCNQIEPAWRNYCLITVATADFSVGGRSLPYQICEKMSTKEKQGCYNQLSGTIAAYASSYKELKSFCAPITETTYHSRCMNIKQF